METETATGRLQKFRKFSPIGFSVLENVWLFFLSRFYDLIEAVIRIAGTHSF